MSSNHDPGNLPLHHRFIAYGMVQMYAEIRVVFCVQVEVATQLAADERRHIVTLDYLLD